MKKINCLLIILVGMSVIYLSQLLVSSNFFNSEDITDKPEKAKSQGFFGAISSWFNSDKYKESIVKEFDFKSGILEVYNQIGAINVESFDKDKIEITVIKKAVHKKLLENVKLDIDVKDNRANIKAEIKMNSIKNSELEVSINIKVPRDTKLENLTTNIGAIVVKNIANSVNAKTDVGAIKLDNINGPITARTNVGAIILSLSKNISAVIKAKAYVGRVNSDFKEIKVEKKFPCVSGEANGQIGNGKNSINLSAAVGSISIEKINTNSVFIKMINIK